MPTPASMSPPSLDSTQKPKRLPNVDTLRLVMACGVVYIHFPFLAKGDSSSLAHVIALALSRAAVPFLFVTSGYFFNRSVERKSGISAERLAIQRALQIFLIYLVWFAVYFLMPYGWLGAFKSGGAIGWWEYVEKHHLSENILRIFIRGTSWHLWFVPAMISAFVAFAIAHKLKALPGLFAVSLLLYASVVMGRTYQESLLAPYCPVVNRGPAVSILPFLIGWYAAKFQYRPGMTTSIGIYLLGAAGSIAEWIIFSPASLQFEFTFFTLIAGVGLLLIGLVPTGNRLLIAIGGFFAPLGLGFYLLHMAVGEGASHALGHLIDSVPWLHFAVTCVLSALLAWLLVSAPMVRRLVR